MHHIPVPPLAVQTADYFLFMVLEVAVYYLRHIKKIKLIN